MSLEIMVRGNGCTNTIVQLRIQVLTTTTTRIGRFESDATKFGPMNERIRNSVDSNSCQSYSIRHRRI